MNSKREYVKDNLSIKNQRQLLKRMISIKVRKYVLSVKRLIVLIKSRSIAQVNALKKQVKNLTLLKKN